MQPKMPPPEDRLRARDEPQGAGSARALFAIILGGLLLVIFTPVALSVRIPGGLDPSWPWCAAAALGLIPFSLWGYRASKRAGRLLRLFACGIALASLGILLIEHYAFTHWEQPLRYGVQVRVP